MNVRNYEVADLNTVPQIINELIQVLTSDFMGLSLSNMTGLALHASVVKSPDNDDEDDEEDEEEDDDDDDEESYEDENFTESDEDSEIKNKDEAVDEESTKRKNNSEIKNTKKLKNEEESESKPGTSASKEQSSDIYYKTESATHSRLGEALDSAREPKCYFEIRRWKQGHYTLITDDDNQIKTKALDLMVFIDNRQFKEMKKLA